MTENIELNTSRNKFLAPIIQSVQLEMDEFMIRVANQECHEMMIYRWAIRLFEGGRSSDYAIRVIHRARRYVLIHRISHSQHPKPQLTLEKILVMLNEHHKYSELDHHTKLIVQKKIAKLFNNNARIEAIEQVLEDINPSLEVEKKQHKITFIKTTINHIMGEIRKWNLTEYWRNKSNH